MFEKFGAEIIRRRIRQAEDRELEGDLVQAARAGEVSRGILADLLPIVERNRLELETITAYHEFLRTNWSTLQAIAKYPRKNKLDN